MTLVQEKIVRTMMASRLRICSAVWLVTRDHHAAEDVFQNIAVKALAADLEFEGEAQLVSWALISARHEALNWIRARKHRMLVLDDEVLGLMEAEWVRSTDGLGGARVEALRDCLERVPEDSRRLLHLRYFEGRSCADAARILKANLETVYQRLSRLHRALRKCIDLRMAIDEHQTGAEAP